MADPARADNPLLAALQGRECRRFLAGCEPIKLAFAQVPSVPGERIRHVYFTTESFNWLTKPLDDPTSVEASRILADYVRQHTDRNAHSV